MRRVLLPAMWQAARPGRLWGATTNTITRGASGCCRGDGELRSVATGLVEKRAQALIHVLPNETSASSSRGPIPTYRS